MWAIARLCLFFFFSSRRRHTRCSRDWSSDVCSSDLLAAGQTVMTLASSTLGNTLVPIFVTAEFRGLNTSVPALLGVVKEQPATPPLPTTVSPLISASLGVVLGSYIKGLNPSTLSVGTGPTSMVISGAGLGAAAS